MLDAYKTYRPDWHKSLMKMRDAFNKPGEDAAIEAIYNEMEKGATEEVTKHVMKDGMIILLPYKWTDIGTWGSVYEFFVDGDGSGNYKDGKVVTVDSTGCLVKSHDNNKLIALAGLEDIVVIDTEDALLVISKDKMDKIKDLQKQIAETEDKKFL
jgi:mannose-1-phosphate guanylyltransferase